MRKKIRTKKGKALFARGGLGSGKRNNLPTERQQKEDNLKERSSERSMQKEERTDFDTLLGAFGPGADKLGQGSPWAYQGKWPGASGDWLLYTPVVGFLGPWRGPQGP